MFESVAAQITINKKNVRITSLRKAPTNNNIDSEQAVWKHTSGCNVLGVNEVGSKAASGVFVVRGSGAQERRTDDCAQELREEIHERCVATTVSNG